MDEWIENVVYMHTMQYSSAIKKNGRLPFVTRRMDLEVMILSEIGQKKTNEYHMFTHRCGIL
jgi:hypothetical protein